MQIETYGNRRYARVENLDDILELLLMESLKQGMVSGGTAQYDSETQKHRIKVDISICQLQEQNDKNDTNSNTNSTAAPGG